MEHIKKDLHETKCLCGKGVVRFYIDEYDANRRFLTCPDCAKRYHVVPDGLMPRHVPLRNPQTRLTDTIKSLEDRLSAKLPPYGMRDMEPFMTDDEKEQFFGKTETRDERMYYLVELWRPELHQMLSELYDMMKWAHLYTKAELESICHDIDCGLYSESSDKFERQFDSVIRSHRVPLLQRVIRDYERHQAIREQWEVKKKEMAAQLDELRKQREAELHDIEERRQKALIPWSALGVLE